MQKTILTLCYLLAVSVQINAQNSRDSLDAELRNIVHNSGIPGLGIGIVSQDSVLFVQGFGYSDVESKKPYLASTIQPVASISKTFIAMALMKLVENGKLDLNDDINNYLPFPIVNPRYPTNKITLLHLVTHTSSIQELEKVNRGSYFIYDRAAPKNIFPKGFYKYYKKYLRNQYVDYPMFVKQYLDPSSESFTSKIFGKYAPGEQFTYSNIGACLAAYIIECVAGESFAEFTRKEIFEPLGMNNTAWSKSDLTSDKLANLYFQNGEEVPEYGLLGYPAGGLYTSTADIMIYMSEVIRGYLGRGTVLSSESYQTLLTNQLDEKFENEMGVFWFINFEENIGHSGFEIGTACNVLFSPSLKKAIFAMVNISSPEDDRLENKYVKILITLSKYARRIN